MSRHLTWPAMALAATLGVAIAAPGAIVAQQGAQALRAGVGVAVETPPEGAPGTGAVDESMLRFHAAQYDYARVDAEIARLRRLHPGWQPPRDLFGGTSRPSGPAVDVSGLWAAYERQDDAAVRREIAALKAVNPDWQPPAELLDLMAGREVRRGLRQAEANADWQAAVALFQRHPRAVGPAPEQIENLWIVAHAYDELGATDQAAALYRRVLDESRDADLRLSTLQKAIAHHGEPGTSRLFELEEGLPKGPAQLARFETIKGDRAGATGGGGSDRLGLALRRISAGQSDAAELAWVADAARERRDANAAMVLGWYAFGARDWPAAERWFSDSLAWRESAKAAEGLARTYMKQGRHDQAERLAAAWVGRDPGLQTLVEDARLAATGGAGATRNPALTLRQANAALTGAADPDPDQLIARGWALYQLDRVAEAVADFEAALDGATIDPTTQAEAARGLALALVKRGLVAEARAVTGRHPPTADQARELEQAMTAQEAEDAYAGGNYDQALTLSRQYRQQAPDSQALVAIEGWSLFQLERYPEAREVFAAMDDGYQSAEVREALRAIDSRQYWEDGTTRDLYRRATR